MFGKDSLHNRINQITSDCYENKKIRDYSVTRPLCDTFKIPTQKLQLNIDYDLPLAELQYTKTRKYKQNLNHVFQLLSTNNHRYKYNDNKIPQKLNKSEYSQAKFNNYQNKKGTLDQDVNDNKFTYEKNKRILSQNSRNIPVSQQVLMKEFQITKDKKYIDQNDRKQKQYVKLNHSQKLKLQKDQQYKIEIIVSSQIAFQFLKQTQTRKNDILLEIEESKQKLQLLKQKVSILKEKNILKDRQIYLNSEQKARQEKKLKNFQNFLKNSVELNKDFQSQHHEIFKKLKNMKKELMKQQKWLQQQNLSIMKIKKQLEYLLGQMRNLEKDQEKRQTLINQIKQEQEINNQLQTQIQDGNSQLIGLKQQVQLLEQQTQTLQTHQNQLNNLQLKFQLQTQKLKQHLHNINSQYQQKINLISQQKEIDSILKDLQLQIGQMNQQKIILQQHIQQTHLKISIKNNNIKHIKNLQSQKSHYQPQKKQIPISPPISQKNNKQDSQRQPKSYNLPHNKQVLPTIRQQSKNTSLYQTPKNPQVFVTQQNEQSHHPFSQNSLELDSQQPSRSQILQPHEEKNQKQFKKYFIIESEQDGASNTKTVYGLRKTSEFLLKKDITSSIQQKMKDKKNQHFNTQNEQIEPQQILEKHNFGLQNGKISMKRQKNENKKDKNRQKGSYKMQQQSVVDNESQFAFQTLIQRFEHIKSNSYFDQSWRQKI